MLAMFMLGRYFCIVGFGTALGQQQHTLLGDGVKEAVLYGGERKLKMSCQSRGRKTALENEKDQAIYDHDVRQQLGQ